MLATTGLFAHTYLNDAKRTELSDGSSALEKRKTVNEQIAVIDEIRADNKQYECF